VCYDTSVCVCVCVCVCVWFHFLCRGAHQHSQPTLHNTQRHTLPTSHPTQLYTLPTTHYLQYTNTRHTPHPLPTLHNATHYVSRPIFNSFAVLIEGKWFCYGLLFLVLMLDIHSYNALLWYEPHKYGQYTGPDGRIYTVEDENVIERVSVCVCLFVCASL
jgi:hypothetical protein